MRKHTSALYTTPLAPPTIEESFLFCVCVCLEMGRGSAKGPCNLYLQRDRIVHGASAHKDLRRPRHRRRIA